MAKKQPRIFISYSHADKEVWLTRFLPRLQEMSASVTAWSDRDIQAGDDWKQEIEEAIEGADLALLLVTPRFLRSEFIRDKEVPRLLDATRRVLWIYLERALWEAAPFANLQALTPTDTPLSDLPEDDQEEAIFNICREIWRLAQSTEEPRTSFLPLRYQSVFVEVDNPRQTIALTTDLLTYRGLKDGLEELPDHIEIIICLPHESQGLKKEHLQTVFICTASSQGVSQDLEQTLAPKHLDSLRRYAPSRMNEDSRKAVLEAIPEVLEDCFVLAVAIPPALLGHALSDRWVAATYETISRILLAAILQVHSESGFRRYSVSLTNIGGLTDQIAKTCEELTMAMGLELVSKESHSDLLELAKLVHWAAQRKTNRNEATWLRMLQEGFAGKAQS